MEAISVPCCSTGNRLRFAICLLPLGFLLLTTRTAAIADETPTGDSVTSILFFRATVESMVQSIDQGENCALLKYRYFASRLPQPFPVAEGYPVVAGALDAEEPPHRRWFLLAGAAAFAGMCSAGSDPEKGFALYARIPDEADRANDKADASAVQAAIADYVMALTFRRTQQGTAFWLRGRPILLQALATHLRLTEAGTDPLGVVPWAGAVSAVDAGDDALRVVDAFLAARGDHVRFETLCAAAAACQPAAPERSLSLLRRAQVMLPAGNPVRRQRFYEQLVGLLRTQKQIAAAVEAQRAAVNDTGHGQAALMELLYLTGDTAGLQDLVKTACDGKVPEEEILDAADRLGAARTDDPSLRQLGHVMEQKLLRGYLDLHKAEQNTGTLRARAGLAMALIADGQKAAAREVLDGCKEPSADADWHARIYAAAIAALQGKAEGPDTK